MATGKNGYFDISTNKNVSVRVNWSEEYDINTNSSVVSVTLYVKALSPYGYYLYTYYPDGTLKVDGKTIVTFNSATPTHSVRINAQDTFYAVSGAPYKSGSIIHDSDGAKTISIAVDVVGYTSDGSADSGWAAQATRTIALTTIPRASSIKATSANIGEVSTIFINQSVSGATHSVHYQFGDISGYVTDDGGVSTSEVKLTNTTIPFTIPSSFYAEIPNSPSDTCVLTCKTYSGAAQIGDTQQTTFIATASKTVCAPAVSGAVVDVNSETIALTGSSSTLVRFCSTAHCTISATANNGSTIVRKTINNVNVDSSCDFGGIESREFIFEAEDSRGYTTYVRVQPQMIDYIKLTNNSYASRNDPTSGDATLTIRGDAFLGSFGSVANSLSVQYRVNSGGWSSVECETSGNSFLSSIVLSGLNYEETHTIDVKVSDQISSVTKAVVLKQGIPVFDWGKNDFSMNVPMHMNKGILLTTPNSLYVSKEDDEDESKLNTWLDEQLANMQALSVKTIAFNCYPAITGRRIFAHLFKFNDSYAALKGFTYANESYLKYKQAGTWNDTVISGTSSGSSSGGSSSDTANAAVSIESVEQTTTSYESDGVNIVTVTLSDGRTSEFEIRNGSQGEGSASMDISAIANLYIWERYVNDESAGKMVTPGATSSAVLQSTTSQTMSYKYYYSDSASVSSSGSISLDDPSSGSFSYNTLTSAQNLIGKYYYREDDTAKTVYYIPESATITRSTSNNNGVTLYRLNVSARAEAQIVSGGKGDFVDYIASYSKTDYPDSGILGDYYFCYMGQLGSGLSFVASSTETSGVTMEQVNEAIQSAIGDAIGGSY